MRRLVRRVAASRLSRDLSDEAIASAMRGLDEPRRICIVAECLTQLPNTVLQDGIRHKGPGPHRVEQLLLRHELPGVFDQMRKHRKRFGPERDLLRAPPELRVPRIETKPPEAQRLALMHYQNITAS
jgi:hypothetical protein